MRVGDRHGRRGRRNLWLRLTLAALPILALAQPAPAVAGPLCSASAAWCGSIQHYTPDGGLDSALYISCKWTSTGPDWSYKYFVHEGESSRKYCEDADGVYVGQNEEIWCKVFKGVNGDYGYYWEKQWDATGWHKFNDFWDDGLGCTKRVD